MSAARNQVGSERRRPSEGRVTRACVGPWLLVCLLALVGSRSSPLRGQLYVGNLTVGTFQQGASTTPQSYTLLLPVEVLGHQGATQTVNFTLAAAADALELTTHNLSYSNKGGISLNGGAWTALNNSTVTPQGLSSNWGGIGGWPALIKLRLTTSLAAGNHTLALRYVRQAEFPTATDPIPDNSIGWSLVDLKAYDDNTQVGLATAQSDPADDDWNPDNVAAGAALWTNAPITFVGTTNLMTATCADCHSRDGGDLWRLKASRSRVIARAKAHSLSDEEAGFIADWHLSHTNIARNEEARWWWPLFQPGEGLDSQPSTEWSAGAGPSAILYDGLELLNELHPGSYGVTNGVAGYNLAAILATNLAPGNHVSVREQRSLFPLPDANQWLNRTHPLDAFTNSAAVSNLLATVDSLRAAAAATNMALYVSLTTTATTLLGTLATEQGHTAWSTNQTRNLALHDAARWLAMRHWEFHETYSLWNLTTNYYGTNAPRGFFWSSFPFNQLSSDIQQRDDEYTGLGQNQPLSSLLNRMAWYELQVITFNGNGKSQVAMVGSGFPGWAGGSPVDVAYVGGANGNTAVLTDAPTLALQLQWGDRFSRFFDNGTSAQYHSPFDASGAQPSGGWNPVLTSGVLPALQYLNFWSSRDNLPTNVVAALFGAQINAWMEKNEEWSDPAIWRLDTAAVNTEGSFLPPSNPPNILNLSAADRFYYMLVAFPYVGVSASAHNRVVDWCKLIWPEYATEFEAERIP